MVKRSRGSDGGRGVLLLLLLLLVVVVLDSSRLRNLVVLMLLVVVVVVNLTPRTALVMVLRAHFVRLLVLMLVIRGHRSLPLRRCVGRGG